MLFALWCTLMCISHLCCWKGGRGGKRRGEKSHSTGREARSQKKIPDTSCTLTCPEVRFENPGNSAEFQHDYLLIIFFWQDRKLRKTISQKLNGLKFKHYVSSSECCTRTPLNAGKARVNCEPKMFPIALI